jgi:hypothetical protein
MGRTSKRAAVALGLAACAAGMSIGCGDNGNGNATQTDDGGHDAGGNGSVRVSISTNDCPIWNTLVANPNTAAPGDSVELVASARGQTISKLTFDWKSSAGTISGSTQDGTGNDTATFTCPSTPATVKITLVVGDGLPAGEICPPHDTTGSITVTCKTPPPGREPGDGG